MKATEQYFYKVLYWSFSAFQKSKSGLMWMTFYYLILGSLGVKGAKLHVSLRRTQQYLCKTLYLSLGLHKWSLLPSCLYARIQNGGINVALACISPPFIPLHKNNISAKQGKRHCMVLCQYLRGIRINWYCLESFARVTRFSAVHLKYMFWMFPGSIRTLVLSERFSTSPNVTFIHLFLGLGQVRVPTAQFRGWYCHLKIAGGTLRSVIHSISCCWSLTP